MAPPTKFARLNQIDPQELATAIQTRVEDHLVSICMQIGLRWKFDESVPHLSSAVFALTKYARGEASLDAPVSEYLITIGPPLWMRAIDRGSYQTAEFDGADPDKLEPEPLDEIVLVMRAAVAREKLEQGQDVTPAELAMLASMAGDAVRLLCARGEIAAKKDGGWAISAAEARRFIAGRGAS